MRGFFGVVRAGLALGVCGLAGMAILAAFGFASPILDVFNHIQAVLFIGCALGLFVAPLAGRTPRRRALLLALAGTGLACSALIVVPEIVAGLEPRPARPTDGRPVIRLMTNNVFALNLDMQRLAGVIAAEKPDIVVLQEFFDDQAGLLMPLIGKDYPYRAECRGGKRANMALYARLPFTQVQDGGCPDDIYSDQRIAHLIAQFTLPDGTAFSVMTTHLDWPAPKIARQQGEFAALAELVAAHPEPLILVGDFNSASWSYALRDFAAATHLDRQDHALLTYPLLWWYFGAWRPTLPFLPLDHIFTKGPVIAHDVHMAAQTGSDHLPLVMDFSVAPGGR